jgi:hypothetical protein
MPQVFPVIPEWNADFRLWSTRFYMIWIWSHPSVSALNSPLVLCAGTTLLSFLFPEPHTCSLTLSSIWNALSPNLGEPGSFSSFRSQLKYLCCREIFWLVLILLPTSHPCSLSQHPGYFPGYGNIDNMQVCGWFVCQWGWGIVYLIHIFILSI